MNEAREVIAQALHEHVAAYRDESWEDMGKEARALSIADADHVVAALTAAGLVVVERCAVCGGSGKTNEIGFGGVVVRERCWKCDGKGLYCDIDPLPEV